MFKNKAIDSLAPQGVDLIELIKMQAGQQAGNVPQDKSGQFSVGTMQKAWLIKSLGHLGHIIIIQ